jgi:putative ABC transport system ATP-binding protein
VTASGLELRAAVKHYRAGEEIIRAVDGVSLQIAAGEMVALYGPSGAGKTTLLLLAAGLLQPDAGEVLFDGEPVPLAGRRPDWLRHQISVIVQAPHLTARETALDNAALKLLAAGQSFREARRSSRMWLERVGLEARAEQPAGKLSMGERQRVAIARALASRPRMLLADEPTAALDSIRSREILTLLRDVAREQRIPVLLVTHDPAAVDVVDRAHTLRDGQLHDGVERALLGAAGA